MKILLTNDDGIQAVGLRALYAALTARGHRVRVVAPVTEQSAVGHAVTLAMPLKVKQFHENGFRGQGVQGTPVDCVKLALSRLLDEPPDLVVSGINAGCNVGVDIIYSGTVSAATEGALMGFPALAVSLDNWTRGTWPNSGLDGGFRGPRGLGRVAAPVRAEPELSGPAPGRDHAAAHLPPDHGGLRGLVRRAHRPARAQVLLARRAHPRGAREPRDGPALLWAGHITLTPLRFNFTDDGAMGTLEAMGLN
jgi:5'-nucleotidase